MTERFKAIAWDVDGTLVDSEPLHYQALVDVCGRYGYRINGIDEETFLGVSITDVWEHIRDNLPEDLLRDDWLVAIDRYYVEHSRTIGVQKGAAELIERSARAGIRQVCVSNSNREVVEANLAVMGVAQHMEFLVCLDDVTNGKPAPEPYALACRKLGIAPQDVLAVEDSRTGAASALAAGLPVAIVGSMAPSGAATFGRFVSLVELCSALFGASAPKGLREPVSAGQ